MTASSRLVPAIAPSHHQENLLLRNSNNEKQKPMAEGEFKDSTMAEVPPPSTESYRDVLVNIFGSSETEEADWGDLVDDKDLPENKWYKEDDMETVQQLASFNPRPVIKFTEEELTKWSKLWRNALIVKVLGKRVNFKLLEGRLHRLWACDGSIKITDLVEDYYLLPLSSAEDYRHALFEGPWKIVDHYLIVQRWRPLFSLSADMTRKVAVWIRIPRLPLELCNPQFLRRIDTTLGTMLCVDDLTTMNDRGKYARICVEIDLDKQLASHIIINGIQILLEYEGLHAICFRCGKYGHKKDNCHEILEIPKTTNQQAMDVVPFTSHHHYLLSSLITITTTTNNNNNNNNNNYNNYNYN